MSPDDQKMMLRGWENMLRRHDDEVLLSKVTGQVNSLMLTYDP